MSHAPPTLPPLAPVSSAQVRVDARHLEGAIVVSASQLRAHVAAAAATAASQNSSSDSARAARGNDNRRLDFGSGVGVGGSTDSAHVSPNPRRNPYTLTGARPPIATEAVRGAASIVTTPVRRGSGSGSVAAVTPAAPMRTASSTPRASDDVVAAIAALSTELRGEMSALRGEVNRRIDALEGSVRDGLKELRGEMSTLRGEVDGLSRTVGGLVRRVDALEQRDASPEAQRPSPSLLTSDTFPPWITDALERVWQSRCPFCVQEFALGPFLKPSDTRVPVDKLANSKEHVRLLVEIKLNAISSIDAWATM